MLAREVAHNQTIVLPKYWGDIHSLALQAKFLEGSRPPVPPGIYAYG